MGAIGEEEIMKWEKLQGAGSAREEKILVLVRLRPLSEKEIARNEVSDWECINETSILFRNSLQERSMFPTAYTFGKNMVSVFFFFLIRCKNMIGHFFWGFGWFVASEPKILVLLLKFGYSDFHCKFQDLFSIPCVLSKVI